MLYLSHVFESFRDNNAGNLRRHFLDFASHNLTVTWRRARPGQGALRRAAGLSLRREPFSPRVAVGSRETAVDCSEAAARPIKQRSKSRSRQQWRDTERSNSKKAYSYTDGIAGRISVCLLYSIIPDRTCLPFLTRS
jgi:hypothetical protein